MVLCLSRMPWIADCHSSFDGAEISSLSLLQSGYLLLCGLKLLDSLLMRFSQSRKLSIKLLNLCFHVED